MPARFRNNPTIFALVILLVSAILGLLVTAVTRRGLSYKDRLQPLLAGTTSPRIHLANGCSIFPENNIWNRRVDDLPLDVHSKTYIQQMYPNLPLHADFSVPYNVVNGTASETRVAFSGGADDSDRAPYRIPNDAAIEPAGDAHVLVVDEPRCRLYELFLAKRVADQQWEASSGAIFDLRSNRLRPAGFTSADAAGLPILPGLVRYEEVESGTIRHALRFTTRLTRREFAWPARHFASQSNDPKLPPMGQRFRLRHSFEIGSFTPEARVILTALKEYGMFLADNGGPWFLTGAPDSRWNSRLSTELRRVSGYEFEAVDSSGLMTNADSGEARR